MSTEAECWEDFARVLGRIAYEQHGKRQQHAENATTEPTIGDQSDERLDQ